LETLVALLTRNPRMALYIGNEYAFEAYNYVKNLII
jgi:hypothetical protein